MRFDRVRELYNEYVDTFRTDGKLPPMMELKRVHTAFVVANAKLIAEGEGMDPGTAGACALAALLHDTGRYEQLKRFGTFRDAESVDHAVLSHEIVSEKGWLDGMEEADAVLKAVLYHDRRDLPAGLDAFAATVANCVRDADKLDIFRVFEHRMDTTDWRNDRTAFWDLPVKPPPDPRVIAAVKELRPVDYRHINSLSDFVLNQVGWLRAELHFGTTRRLADERGHLAYRRRVLAEISGGDPSVDALCTHIALGEIGFDGICEELRRGNRVLLLVRHAERPRIDGDDPTFGGELPLTAEGWRTSVEFGRALKPFAAGAQFRASPLRRTCMTAEGIAEGMGLAGAEIERDPAIGNDCAYVANLHEVFELFRDGSFFEKIFDYMRCGVQRGFREIRQASDEFEDWATGRFAGRLGVFASHDLYIAAFLHSRGVKRDWTKENWTRFLDAAAIVMVPDGTRKYALLRSGLSSGVVGVRGE